MANQFALGTFSQVGGKSFPGVVIAQQVIPLSEFPQLTSANSILSLLENWDANFAALQAASLDDANAIPLKQLKVHPPVNLPRQVFCSGANYKKHVIDLIIDEGGGPMTENMTPEERRGWATKMMDDRAANGIPYMFSKPVSVVTGAYDNIVLPPHAKAPDWELELAVIIGRKARHVTKADALNYRGLRYRQRHHQPQSRLSPRCRQGDGVGLDCGKRFADVFALQPVPRACGVCA